MEVKLNVTGMSCHHCEARVSANIKELDGINEVIASAFKKEIIVKYDDKKATIEKIKEKIIDTGYQVK